MSKAKESRRRTTREGPRNSLGLPWAQGQTWTCARCGGSGPDRDDVVLAECGAGAARRTYHDLAFHPPEHAAALAARHERIAREARS